jgi:hypothetical protein
MCGGPRVVVARVLGVLLAVAPGVPRVAAQEHVTIRTDVLLYGDNTEFHNPFREGDTLLGAATRLLAGLDLGDRVTLDLGAFGNLRFGSEESFEQVRPVISLTVRGRRSAFVFGTLPGPSVTSPMGPDRGGPHGLLPPLQRETLSYDRACEAGLSWTFSGPSVRHAAWLNWQRLNTSAHRERFDAGVSAVTRVTDHVSLPVQLHVVHEGGQQYASGPVADSAALAAGVEVHGALGDHWLASVELLGAGSRFVPDRQRPDLDRDGLAVFGRGALERSGWRGHLIVWRGRHFVKDEGDANYLSVTRRGEPYLGTRDYAEAGLTRRFALSPVAVLEVSGRVHRVEHHYEYSYRVLSIVTPSWRVR